MTWANPIERKHHGRAPLMPSRVSLLTWRVSSSSCFSPGSDFLEEEKEEEDNECDDCEDIFHRPSEPPNLTQKVKNRMQTTANATGHRDQVPSFQKQADKPYAFSVSGILKTTLFASSRCSCERSRDDLSINAFLVRSSAFARRLPRPQTHLFSTTGSSSGYFPTPWSNSGQLHRREAEGSGGKRGTVEREGRRTEDERGK